MGHQSSRKRAGPSYLRRQEKRAAARVAAAATSAVEEAVQDKVEYADTAPPAASTTSASVAAPPGSRQAARTCSKCGQPCRGHVGPTGAKCSNTLPLSSTREKMRSPSPSTSLHFTPVREARVEDCSNCGGFMTPTHQCDQSSNQTAPEETETDPEPECSWSCPCLMYNHDPCPYSCKSRDPFKSCECGNCLMMKDYQD